MSDSPPAPQGTAIASSDQPKLHPLLSLPSLPTGVRFICKYDEKTGMYYLPSHKSTFGGIKVSNLFADCSCTGVLLAIETEVELREMFQNFPVDKYELTVGISIGTAGNAYVIIVKGVSGSVKFPVYLGVDVFSDTLLCSTPLLRFSVSSAMCRLIVSDSQLSARFIAPHMKKLTEASEQNIPPLKVSLMGNLIMNKLEWVKVGGILFFVNISESPDDFLRTDSRFAREISAALGPDPDPESRAALDSYCDYFGPYYEDIEFDF